MYDLRFIRIAALKETKVLWHNGRRGDKQTGGQQFQSHTQLEVNKTALLSRQIDRIFLTNFCVECVEFLSSNSTHSTQKYVRKLR